MIGWLGTVLIVGSLLIAASAGITALLRRAPWRGTLVAVAVTELVLVAQAVVAIAASISGQGADTPVLFFSYVFFAVFVLPVAVLLARSEPNRSGSLVLVIAGLVLAVLIVRLRQIWGADIG